SQVHDQKLNFESPGVDVTVGSFLILCPRTQSDRAYIQDRNRLSNRPPLQSTARTAIAARAFMVDFLDSFFNSAAWRTPKSAHFPNTTFLLLGNEQPLELQRPTPA